MNQELRSLFLPRIDSSEDLIAHRALFLVYDETHEQAKWVLHKISTNISQASSISITSTHPSLKHNNHTPNNSPRKKITIIIIEVIITKVVVSTLVGENNFITLIINSRQSQNTILVLVNT